MCFCSLCPPTSSDEVRYVGRSPKPFEGRSLALPTVAMRRLGEGGPGTKPNEYYAFRAVPRMSEAKSGVQSVGRAEKKSWYTEFHKKQLRVAPLSRSQETRSEATKFRIAELVAPGFVMVQIPVIGAGAKRKNHDNCVSRSFLRSPKLSLTSVAFFDLRSFL